MGNSCCPLRTLRALLLQQEQHGASSRSRAVASRPSPEGDWTPAEQAVAHVWEAVLRQQGSIRPTDSFLHVGGESLLALRVCATLQYMILGVGFNEEDEVPPQFGDTGGAFAVTSLLTSPSLRAYCQHLENAGLNLSVLQAQQAKVDFNASTVYVDQKAVTLAEVRAVARSRADAAPGHLAELVDVLPSHVAGLWAGLASEGGARTQQPTFTALHAAAQAGSVGCVRMLLERRARPTATEGGAAMTALHYAAMFSPPCLRLLLESAAPLTVRDARGQSLLHAAARAGNTSSLQLILDWKAIGGNTSRRALRAGEGSKGLVEWKDRWSRTAVHWAVLNGHAAALTMLLSSGALALPKSMSAHQQAKRTHLPQESPLQIAVRVHGQDSKLVELLEVHNDSEDQEATEERCVPYLLTLGSAHGLDRLALWELKEMVAASSVQRVQCRIFFSSAARPLNFKPLKAAEKICVVLLRTGAEELVKLVAAALADGSVCKPPTPVESKTPWKVGAEEKAVAAWIVSTSSWNDGVKVWKKFQALETESSNAVSTEQLTFKVTCRRAGQRHARIASQGLAVALASALSAAHGWRPQVKRPDMEIRVLISDMEVLVDIPVLVQAAVPTGGGELREAGMSAPVAWALARSAELKPGEVVLDPMCGKAVTLVEAALSWPSCAYLGIEKDERQLRGALANVQLISGIHTNLLQGDARSLPLPDTSIDVVICDVPFGRQYGTVEECRGGLYTELLQEIDRVVVRPSGRAVLLTSVEQEPWLLNAAGFAVPELGLHAPPHAKGTWICVARRDLQLGFLPAVVVVLQRPDAGLSCTDLPSRNSRLWWESSAGRGEWASLKVGSRPPMQPARQREI